MCGIAGYGLSRRSSIDRTLAAQALLAGIAERGEDAVGYGHRADTIVSIHKQQTGPTALLETLAIPQDAIHALLHVRDFTKGPPAIAANNHPIRHGAVVGIHNGIIVNDEELLERHAIEHAEPEMTVDSEAIFALVDRFGPTPTALEELTGAMATAWLDSREPASLRLARGVARPLWIGRGRHELFFASTRAALDVVEQTLRIHLMKTEITEGRLLEVREGQIVDQVRWSPDRRYREQNALPPVRAAHEGRLCRERLAAISATA